MAFWDRWLNKETVAARAPQHGGSVGAEMRLTIAKGYDGAQQFSIDLGKSYRYVRIFCNDTSGIARGTLWNAYTAPREQTALKPMFLHQGFGIDNVLPFVFEIQCQDGARRVKVVLSNPVSKDTVFIIQGVREH